MGEFKRFFCLLLVGLWACFVGKNVYAQESGTTPWTELPFGQMRLLSCREGIQKHPVLVGGLQIQLNQGWFLKKPHLKTVDEKMPLWVEYPIRPDSNETTLYRGNLFIPLVGTALSKGAAFGVEGDLEGCRSYQDCLKLPIRFQMPLLENSDEYTGYCAFIMDQMKQVPMPAPKEFTVRIKKLSNQQEMLIFSGLKGLTQAFLQNDSGLKFHLMEREFLSDGVRFRVSLSQIPPKQNWILITNQGVFRFTDFLDSSVPERAFNLPWVKLIFGGFLLFLFSPFFFWWGVAWPKKKGCVAFQSAEMCQQATYILLVWVLLMLFLFPKIQGLFYQPIYLWILLGILILTLIIPPKNPWLIGGLFILMPKPYLKDLFMVFEGQKSLWFLGLINFILWTWLFFWLRSKYGNFLEKKIQMGLKKACFRINLFFLLPTLILTCYVGRLVGQGDIPFTNQITNGINVVCAPYRLECSDWEQDKINLIDSTTALGQKLLKKYNRFMGPLVILNTPDEQTIFCEGVSLKKVKNFIIDWQNYHVLGKPENLPIHFGDDPHAP